MKLDEISYTSDGRYILLRTEGLGAGTRRLFVFENGKDSVPRLLIQSRFDHYAMALSPDGHWLAYVSEESGTPEVYVRPFPNVDSARFTISVGGGTEPVWRRDGKELFFRTPRGDMIVVPVTTGGRFDHGTPRELFAIPGLTQDNYHSAYDISPDGGRFLMVTAGGGDAATIDLIFNWRIDLERLLAAQR